VPRARRGRAAGRGAMIKDPPMLRIRRGFARPAAELLAAFAGVPTGHLVDAMGGAGCLDYRVKPLAGAASAMVGPAITAEAGPADNLALFGAIHAARPGDILVAATGGFTGTAVAGDLLLGMARNRGIAGFVTDGLARDIAGIRALGMPVHCAGVSANSPSRGGPGTVGLPIIVGGVMVEAGDIVVGDRDGVVVVPLARAESVLAALGQVREAEARLEAQVNAGLQIPDFMELVLASGRVEEIG